MWKIMRWRGYQDLRRRALAVQLYLNRNNSNGTVCSAVISLGVCILQAVVLYYVKHVGMLYYINLFFRHHNNIIFRL